MGSSTRCRPLALPSDLSAPAAARRFSGQVLATWNLAELVDAVYLVVSELVTNAVRHGSPPVWIELSRVEDQVRIAVHDGSPSLSAAPGRDDNRESGRGLELVRALSTSCGVSREGADGKTAWANVAKEAV